MCFNIFCNGWFWKYVDIKAFAPQTSALLAHLSKSSGWAFVIPWMSVVRRASVNNFQQSSPLKLLDGISLNFIRMMLMMRASKFLILVWFHEELWLLWQLMFSIVLYRQLLKKSSSLKVLDEMSPNFIRIILMIGRC